MVPKVLEAGIPRYRGYSIRANNYQHFGILFGLLHYIGPAERCSSERMGAPAKIIGLSRAHDISPDSKFPQPLAEILISAVYQDDR